MTSGSVYSMNRRSFLTNIHCYFRIWKLVSRVGNVCPVLWPRKIQPKPVLEIMSITNLNHHSHVISSKDPVGHFYDFLSTANAQNCSTVIMKNRL